MKRKRASAMASSSWFTVKPSRFPEQESVRCRGSETASSNRTRPQIQSRSRKGTKTRNINDVIKDERSKISGINRILGTPIPVSNNLTWRLLKSHMRIESYYGTKLHSALNAIHECFEPSKDPYTSRDIAEDIVFDLESDSELNLRGFYTVVLERRDDDGHEEMIGAATVRINKEVAEVPLVATRPQFRRLGMCRILMNELENRLMEFGVESSAFFLDLKSNPPTCLKKLEFAQASVPQNMDGMGWKRSHYTVGLWEATAIGIISKPCNHNGCHEAFWTSCQVISKLLSFMLLWKGFVLRTCCIEAFILPTRPHAFVFPKLCNITGILFMLQIYGLIP